MFGISSKPSQRWSLYFLQTLRRIQSLLSPMNITDNITLLHTNTLLSLRPLLSTLAPFPRFLLLMTTWARVFLHCCSLSVSAQPCGQFSHKADWIHSYSPPLFLLSLFCALDKEKGWSNKVSSPHTHTAYKWTLTNETHCTEMAGRRHAAWIQAVVKFRPSWHSKTCILI